MFAFASAVDSRMFFCFFSQIVKPGRRIEISSQRIESEDRKRTEELVKIIRFIALAFILTLPRFCLGAQKILPPLPPDPELNLWLLTEFQALFPERSAEIPGVAKTVSTTLETSVPSL